MASRDSGARRLVPRSAVANGQPEAHLKFRAFFADALWASEAQKSIARETKKAASLIMTAANLKGELTICSKAYPSA